MESAISVKKPILICLAIILVASFLLSYQGVISSSSRPKPSITIAIDAGHGHTYTAKLENGKIVSTEFVEEKDSATLPKDKITTTSCSVVTALDNIVRTKWAENNFVNVFEPYYMRKSQAERNNEI